MPARRLVAPKGSTSAADPCSAGVESAHSGNRSDRDYRSKADLERDASLEKPELLVGNKIVATDFNGHVDVKTNGRPRTMP